MAVSPRLIATRATIDGSQEIARITGLDELNKRLREIPVKLRVKALRQALAAGARRVQADAKQGAPVLSADAAKKAPYRTPGTVRDAIRIRTSKIAKRSGDVGVFVNVKPLKKGLRSAKNPRDPFYWRWAEFGPNKSGSTGFLRPAAKQLGEALKIFERRMSLWFARTDAEGKVRE